MGRKMIISGQTSRYSHNETARSAQRYITSQHRLDYLTNRFGRRDDSQPNAHLTSRVVVTLHSHHDDSRWAFGGELGLADAQVYLPILIGEIDTPESRVRGQMS